MLIDDYLNLPIEVVGGVIYESGASYVIGARGDYTKGMCEAGCLYRFDHTPNVVFDQWYLIGGNEDNPFFRWPVYGARLK